MMTVSMKDTRIRAVSGRGLPLPGNDIDTDRIIPARFMKCVTFDDLGAYLFYDSRFGPDDSKKEHPFNDEKHQGASILIVNRNFGCGSSREHAPQSIIRHGIRAIIGESFAEIFADNCTAIGLPAVTADRKDVEGLMSFAKDQPGSSLTLDLEKKEISFGDTRIMVMIPEHSRSALTQGTWDTTSELLSEEERIRNVAKDLPYMNGFKNAGHS